MADPSFLINHAVNYFLSQWYSGLQPSLNINTCYNGEIFISSKVKSIGQELYSNRRRRSGRHARERRRKERSPTIASDKSIVEERVQLKTAEEKNSLGNSHSLASDDEPTLNLSIKYDAVPDVLIKEATLIDAAVQAVPILYDAVCQSEQVKPDVDLFKYSGSNLDESHQCSFCEEAFDDSIIDWKHFVNHLQQFNFMCSDCLDFFTLKPWFLASDLVAIDVDGGVDLFQSHLVINLKPDIWMP